MSRSVPCRDLFKAHYGKALKADQRVSDGSVAVYGSSGFVGNHDQPLTTEPTIIVGRKGSVGEIAYVKDASWTIDTAYYLELLDNSHCDLRYLYYALKSARLVDKSITTSIPGLNRDDLYDTQIPLPPLEEQKRIATILDKADTIRHKRQQAIELADQVLRSVFLDMFGDPLNNPKGLETRKISQLGTVLTGNTPSRKKPEYYGDHLEWIKSDNINTPNHYLTEAHEWLSELGALVGRVVPEGSLLVTCIAGSKGCIGNLAIADRKVAFNQQINSITPFEPELLNFIYVQILFHKRLIQKASTDGMKGLVSKSKFSDIELVVPHRDAMKDFNRMFELHLSCVDRMESQLQHADDLFDSLSQQLLLSGPNDDEEQAA